MSLSSYFLSSYVIQNSLFDQVRSPSSSLTIRTLDFKICNMDLIKDTATFSSPDNISVKSSNYPSAAFVNSNTSISYHVGIR